MRRRARAVVVPAFAVSAIVRLVCLLLVSAVLWDALFQLGLGLWRLGTAP